MTFDLNPLMFRCLELQETLYNPEVTEEEKTKLVVKAIEAELRDGHKFPEFDPGWEWFNTSRPLTLSQDLSGSVVVIDFFTYCCINCMHILPDLEDLEGKFPPESGLVVVGVHSAKFENEKVSSNIISAIKRYGIHHPVINDSNAVLWTKLGVTCWPTLLILGPSGTPLFSIVGEGHRGLLFRYVEAAINYFQASGQLSPAKSLPLNVSSVTPLKSELLFPGKVALAGCDPRAVQGIVQPNPAGPSNLIVSDSGHHRILLTTAKGQIKEIIGGPDAGFQDGDFSSARFRNPQGVAWSPPHFIYVADTGNHAIRKVDLKLRKVDTVAGTGVQGTDKEGGKMGTEQSLASPWDVCLAYTPSVDTSNAENEPDLLLIANAGTHQIWGLTLRDLKWWKGSEMKSGQCFRIAGNGAEENRNNSYPHRAAFAQPSGLCLAVQDSGSFLYIADSESSSIRQMLMKDGSVKALVGGDKDPMNLFAFGDQDNYGDPKKPALFQHPLGVAWDPNKQLLYVADSYNHKIKQVDPRTKEVKTLIGNGQPGSGNGKSDGGSLIQLNEPGGLCFDVGSNSLYVADTNNHCIRKVFLLENVVETVHVSQEDKQLQVPAKVANLVEKINVPHTGATLKWQMKFIPSDRWKFSEDAPHYCKLYSPDKWQVSPKKYLLSNGGTETEIRVPAAKEAAEVDKLRTDVQLYLCSKESGVCKGESLVLELEIHYNENEETNNEVQHSTTVSLP